MIKYYAKAAAHQLFIGLTCFASVVFLFSYFGNYDPPVSFIKAYAQPEPVKPGGVLTIYWEVERTRRCSTEFDRSLYEDATEFRKRKRIDVPNYIKEGGLPLTSREEFKTEVKIPEDMAPGPATYQSTGLYACNLFQKLKPIVVPAPEVRFLVSEK